MVATLPYIVFGIKFQGQVPTTLDYNVGYMEGSQLQGKIWLVTSEDLKLMYEISKDNAVG